VSGVPLAIRCGTLHAEPGEAPLRNVTLLVRDGLVADCGPDVAIPAEARRLEAASVVPGLINAHAHLELSGEAQTTSVMLLLTATQRALTCAANARRSLHGGVTTIRDLGASETLAIDVRDAIAAGTLEGPTVLAAGKVVCMTGGHGWWIGREADGGADVRKAVREQRKAGADCIKFIATGGVLTKGAVPAIAQLDEDELRAGVTEAHAHGLRCAAHAIGADGVKNALRAGVDSIEHGMLLDDEAIALFVERGTYLVPTLAAVTCIVEFGTDAGIPQWAVGKARDIANRMTHNLTRARAAGVRFAGGSDAGTPFNLHERYWYEVELLQSVLGMTPREALRTATVASADLLGVARGRLSPGAPADALLLRRDIDEDPRALREPIAVVKDGALVSRGEPVTPPAARP
jgi:imidazolonepropionase-like amidohydrolase